jgi:uncharacterized protein
MQLYAGSSRQFIEDAVQSRLAEKLKVAYKNYYKRDPPAGEHRSWQNSLSRMCMVMQYASLLDNGVLLEYKLPHTSNRLDLMITGYGKASEPNAVIVELKQWEDVRPSWIPESVVTYVGKGWRDVAHPSRQVGNYQLYLENTHTAFQEGGVGLAACSYLHNIQFTEQNELFHPRHASLLKEYPLYAGDQTSELTEFIASRVGEGDGQEVLATVLQSKYRASKKLLEHVGQVIRREKTYVLLDEQQVAFNAVLAAAQKGFHDKEKVVILIQGGPGTGKSILALNLVAELSAQGYNAQHATGSKAFTENVRKILGSKAAIQFKFFASYQGVERDAVDVLILDEAHRMYATGNTRFTPTAERSDRPLIEHVIEAAKVSVFFIDDLQVVRPDEVGRTALIRDTATKLSVRLHEFELDSQFRCMGSDGFINWVDTTLGLRETANVYWDSSDPFEFKIFDGVKELEVAIREKAEQGFKARLAAGFCWPWSKPGPSGNLVNDVLVGDWSMPWNARSDSTRLGEGIPKSHYWATDPRGINQVGCVYTAQNFEFDYVGVIFGSDLRYDTVSGTWVGDKSKSFDSAVKRSKNQFVDLVKNAYRILLTRGMKGCYVYFVDENTRDFFGSLIKKSPSESEG